MLEQQATFSLGEAEAILAEMFGIHPTKRATFNARLQQLQRLGLPPGANMGRGKRVRYQPWQLAEFVLYLDLIDAGLTPSVIATHLKENGYYSMLGGGYQVEAAPATQQKGLRLVFEINGLNYLRRAAEAAAPVATDQYVRWGRGAEAVLESASPAITINLSMRIAELKAAIAKVLPERATDRLFSDHGLQSPGALG